MMHSGSQALADFWPKPVILPQAGPHPDDEAYQP